MIKQKAKGGRKPKPENEKVKTKQVYLTDKEEKVILKQSKTKDLTAALRTLTQ